MPFVNKNPSKVIPNPNTTSTTSSSSSSSNRPNSIQSSNSNHLQNAHIHPNRPIHSNNLIVNKRQQQNPVLGLIKSVPWEFGETISDYQFNQTTGSLFLSLKYHKLHPDYLDLRLKRINQAYDLKILLCLCDIQDHELVLREITKICVVNRITLIVGWSNFEIARYIQLFKSFENRSPDLIKERVDETDYVSRLTNVLTTVRGINKTDVLTLLTNFGSFRQIVEATPHELSLCPGLGEKKVKRLLEAFHSNFRGTSTTITTSSHTASTTGTITTATALQGPSTSGDLETVGDRDRHLDALDEVHHD